MIIKNTHTENKTQQEQEPIQKLQLPTKEEHERGLYQSKYFYESKLKTEKQDKKREIERAREQLKEKIVFLKAKEQDTKNTLKELQTKLKDKNSYKNRIDDLRESYKHLEMIENKDSEVLK